MASSRVFRRENKGSLEAGDEEAMRLCDIRFNINLPYT
jgi:hypothetical protein